MARRQGTFEEIQLAKPFSEFGQRNLQALAVAYTESAEERGQEAMGLHLFCRLEGEETQ